MDLAGGLSRRQLDNCEKSVAASSASRYASIQFFASLRKWIGARNPVKIGSSCAAVTGYNFPSANRPPKAFGGGEGGKKGETRSQNICPVCLIRARVCGARKNFFAKRRMRAGRCGLGHTSPTLGVGGNLYAKSPNMVCCIQFSKRRMFTACARRRNIDIYRSGENGGIRARRRLCNAF